MPDNHNEIEKDLWDATDELRANSKLKSSEYSVPVLGLIFLRYADHKFSKVEKELTAKNTGRRKIGKTDYQARGVLYLPEKARELMVRLGRKAEFTSYLDEVRAAHKPKRNFMKLLDQAKL